MLTKSKLGIMGGVALVAVLVVISVNGLSPNPDITSEKPTKPQGSFPPPYPLLSGYQPPVSLTQATSLVGFTVSEPTYLPQGYRVQTVRANAESDEVVLFAWDRPITDQTTNQEFLYQGKGIIIYLTTTSPTFNMTDSVDKWLEDKKQYSAHKITVKGFPGVAYNQQIVTDDFGEQVPVLTEVMFFKNSLFVKVRGDLPEAVLIKVAESMA